MDVRFPLCARIEEAAMPIGISTKLHHRIGTLWQTLHRTLNQNLTWIAP